MISPPISTRPIALFAALPILLVALALFATPPVTDLDEPWRLLHISEGRNAALTPHGYLLAGRLAWRVVGGDLDRYLLLHDVAFLAIAAAFLTLLLDTARRLGAGDESLLLFLPAFAIARLWAGLLPGKEYLPGSLLLLLYGRTLLFAPLGAGIEAVVLLGIGFFSQTAGITAIGMRVLFSRDLALVRLLPLVGLLALEYGTAFAVRSGEEAVSREPRSVLFYLRRVAVEPAWYIGLFHEWIPSFALPARILLAGIAGGEILRGVIGSPRGRLLFLWGFWWAFAYVAARLLIPTFQLRYLFFYAWFWIPILLAAAPSGPIARPLRFLAAAFFFLLATTWLPLLADAPGSNSYLASVRAARASVGSDTAPWIFVDAGLRLTARVDGIRSPYVVSDTAWDANWVIDPACGYPSYLTGDEVVLNRVPASPIPEGWALTGDDESQEAIVRRALRRIGGTITETRPVPGARLSKWSFPRPEKSERVLPGG